MARVDRDYLIGFLAGIKQGQVEDTGELARHLSDVWNDLAGSHDQKTTPNKLTSRPLEDVIWSPPLLLFTLERHGGTVNGSSRAELHRWEVDVERWQASIKSKGRRQLTKQDKKYNPASDIDAICEPVETATVINESRFPRLHFLNTDYGRMHSTGCELELDYISFFQVSH